ncbi:glycosyltransferase family 2 protein [Pelagibacterales bacterium SAG-MED22]|nr:glycosyltransferase family 2 protein [Pelagibacterales bacterium SAG-MED22]
MKSLLDISIVIPTFYPGSIINKCLETLPEVDDIIIVDNGHNDIELENIIKKTDLNIKHFKIGDVGLPKSFNFAVKKAKSKNILITQPDVTFETNTIHNLLGALNKYENVGLLAPLIYENNKYSQFDTLNLNLSKNGKLLRLKSKFKGSNIVPEGDCCVEAVNATTMLLKKNILQQINGWDENIYTYLEDLDLCLKLRRKNYQIIKISSSKVNHIGFGSHKKENASKSELSRNWHFIWSSLYFKHKYTSKLEFIFFYIKNFFKYFFKTILNGVIFKKKKTVLNFTRLKACVNFLFIKKSNYRIKF